MSFPDTAAVDLASAASLDAIRAELHRLIAEAECAAHARSPDAARARAIHARRALEDAIEHGVAVLDALDEPAMDREDADPAEHDGTAEHSLGAPENHPTLGTTWLSRDTSGSQTHWARGANDNGEREIEDEHGDDLDRGEYDSADYEGDDQPVPEWDGTGDNWSQAGGVYA